MDVKYEMILLLCSVLFMMLALFFAEVMAAPISAMFSMVVAGLMLAVAGNSVMKGG